MPRKIGDEEHYPCTITLEATDIKQALRKWSRGEGFIFDQRDQVAINHKDVEARIPILPPGHSHYERAEAPEIRKSEIRKSETGEVGVRLWIAIIDDGGIIDALPMERSRTRAEVIEHFVEEKGHDLSTDTRVTIAGPFFLNLNIVDQELARVEQRAREIERDPA